MRKINKKNSLGKMEKKFHLKMTMMILMKMMSYILMNRKLYKLKAVTKIGRIKMTREKMLRKKSIQRKKKINKKINKKLKLFLKFGMIQKSL
jgi:hypothetical protein